MHSWRHIVVGITWVMAFPMVTQAQSPFALFIAQLNELDPLIAEAERHSDGERQAARYRCLRHDLTLMETGLSAYIRTENAPPAPLTPLCGDYRGLESNPVVVSTPQERTALAYLAEEIRALIAGVAALERHGWFRDLNLFGMYLRQHDDDPKGTGEEIDTDAWFAEVNYVFYPWLIGVLRYGETDIDLGFPTSTDPDAQRFLVPAVVFMARANVKFTAEAQVRLDDAGKADDRYILAVDFGL